MITVTVKKNSQTIFTHEVSSFAVGDVLSVLLTGGYVEPSIQKNSLCSVEISDGETVISKLCTFLSYQFNVQTYQQTGENGITQTLTGVTNNSLVFALVG
ncbi:MAG: hypothetical protein WC117_03040 [Sphaerochaetaceae bacterium]